MTGPTIALVGIMLESNAFAPVTTEADFRGNLYMEGAELVEDARRAISHVPKELCGFVQAMDDTGPWTPLPLLITSSGPWGPADQAFVNQCLNRITAMLAEAGPVDGVYVANHGAMTATGSTDPDGDMLMALRAQVGAEVPIVVTLDLHANISKAMAEAAHMIVGYRTNPHVDMLARGEEAAFAIRRMIAGQRPECVVVKLPLVPPSVTLLTADGPYGDLIDYGQRRQAESSGAILNVSVFGGFAFSDAPKTGISVVVTARSNRNDAERLAREIADKAWDMRARFKKTLTSIDDAVAEAEQVVADRTAPALIFSDAGDNPGGGGEGRTTWLLDALVKAGIDGVLYGSFFDPALAEEAAALGVGAEFDARFNRDVETATSKPLTLPARVIAVLNQPISGRRGIYAGRQIDLSPAVALALGDGGITAIVISARHQTADPMFFEAFGLDIAAARVVCVKSRGHFRAGFDEWFPPAQVREVDTAGLTAPVLDRFDWKGLARPVYPLDPDTVWSPDD